MNAPEIRVTGTLGRDAEARAGTGDDWWLFLEIHQGASGLAVAAAKHIGSGASAAIASKSMAHHLRRGTPVTVRAARYDIRLTPTPHLVLVNVQHIDYQAHAYAQERAA